MEIGTCNNSEFNKAIIVRTNNENYARSLLSEDIQAQLFKLNQYGILIRIKQNELACYMLKNVKEQGPLDEFIDAGCVLLKQKVVV